MTTNNTYQTSRAAFKWKFSQTAAYHVQLLMKDFMVAGGQKINSKLLYLFTYLLKMTVNYKLTPVCFAR